MPGLVGQRVVLGALGAVVFWPLSSALECSAWGCERSSGLCIVVQRDQDWDSLWNWIVCEHCLFSFERVRAFPRCQSRHLVLFRGFLYAGIGSALLF